MSKNEEEPKAIKKALISSTELEQGKKKKKK
jgi:hypothetical protein